MAAYILMLLLGGVPAFAAEMMPPPVEEEMPATDQRAIRELQNRAFGSPSLKPAAPRQEALLGLAELGGAVNTSAGKSFTAEDKDALFALLQRYRDELLKMGMDSAELQAQLAVLESRSGELERRLAALKPLDGLKIHGRFYSAFDDLHLLGAPSIIAVPGLTGGIAKAANKSLRAQMGVVHSEMRFEGTRGLFSGMAQIDVIGPWGVGDVKIGYRRIYLEMRTPIAIQFGDLDAALTPLTLWRSEQYEPFLPQPFFDRRQRQRDDMLLRPDRWRVMGVRASTRLTLFSAMDVDLESITSIMGYPTITAGPTKNIYSYMNMTTPNVSYLLTRYSTYMEAWKAGFHLGGWGVLSYNGVLFWDETSSVVTPGVYRAMNSMVQSGRLEAGTGSLKAELEGAVSSHDQPTWATHTAAPNLAGSAFIGAGTWSGSKGSLRVFGRAVSSGFLAAGAQGRTVDYNWQFLGPFLSENSQINPNGTIGLDLEGNRIPISHASRLNDRLIPPGTYLQADGSPAPPVNNHPGKTWQHLLAYGPGEEIDPYGPATPNRVGGGVEMQGKLFGGGLLPLASAEMFQHAEAVTNAAGVTETAYAMTRFRGGLEIDLEPWTGWPLRFGGGYTMTGSSSSTAYYDASTGTSPTSGANTSLIDASIQWGAGKPMGLAVGYRNLVASGRNELVNYKTAAYNTWDIVGIGGWWRPADKATVDVVYSSGHNAAPSPSTAVLEIDQFLTRLTVEF